MRLLVLSFVYARNPVGGIAILAEHYTRCQRATTLARSKPLLCIQPPKS
jgi:hypothetical protein